MSTATSAIPAEEPAPEPEERLRRRWGRPVRTSLPRALVAYAIAAIGAGLVAGVLWRAIVKLPAYHLDDSSYARITEQDLAAIFSIDAWFACMGLGAGLVLGLAAWVFFRRLGWIAALVALAGSAIAALTCWGLGSSVLGPGPLQNRLASAHVGDSVPVDFQLHALATLAVWPFGAMVPLLLLSAFTRDPEEPAAVASARDGGHAGVEQPDEPGRVKLDL